MSCSTLAEHQSQALLDRLDAAKALLGVTSTSCADQVASLFSSTTEENSGGFSLDDHDGAEYIKSGNHDEVSMTLDEDRAPPLQEEPTSAIERPRGGLDALAALASKEASMDYAQSLIANAISSSSSASSSDDDSETMPPPPPRRRLRSASNPEGMEKWDALSDRQFSRQHFVLPSAILEEELAEASAAMKAKADEEDTRRQGALPIKKRARKGSFSNSFGTSPDSVTSPLARNVAVKSETEDDTIPGDELLRRARSRLLEDLSEGNITGDKGVLTLPHSLSKYKEVYNKNGRIGIYTPSERAAIIARFNDKRSRRVWNKKIRYNCRKSLADRRMRVKGRFVKRATEQMVKSRFDMPFKCSSPTLSETLDEKEDTPDEDMPDVNDPEAGFAPTADQPYRRLRRHTIT